MLVLMSMTVIFSCNHRTEPEQTPIVYVSIDYDPALAVGNRWMYTGAQMDSSGKIEYTWPDSLVYSGDTVIQGRHWFYYESLGHRPAHCNSPHGVLIRLVSAFADTSVFTLYKSPTYIGDTFPGIEIAYAGRSAWLVMAGQWNVISLDTLVTVKAGTFHCVHFRLYSENRTGWSDNFYSPHFGRIRKDFYTQSDPSTPPYHYGTYQLDSISLK